MADHRTASRWPKSCVAMASPRHRNAESKGQRAKGREQRAKGKGIIENGLISALCLLPSAFRLRFFSSLLESELRFHLGDAFSRYRQLRLSILQSDDRLAGEPGVDFLDRADVHQCRAMDAQPLTGIEPRLEIREREIQSVVFLAGYRE